MNPGVQIDTISAGRNGLTGSGDVAKALMANGFNVNALRTLDVLRKDEWELYDTRLIEVARKKLNFVQALIDGDLTYSIPNGLGTTILEWEKVSDMDPADVSMDGVTRGEQDIVEFSLAQLPLPIIHKDFSINIRKLEASRTTGQSLDTTQGELAMKLVAEKVESMAIVGHATRVGAARIYGLTNEPNINTGSQTGTTGWDTDSTGEEILADVIAMIAQAQGDRYYGPYALVVTYAAWNRMAGDFKANSDKSIRQRLMELEDLNKIIPTTDLPANSCALVQMSRDVVDEVIGLQPTMVQWNTQGGMMLHYKVMAIMVPRFKSTETLQSGIVYYT